MSEQVRVASKDRDLPVAMNLQRRQVGSCCACSSRRRQYARRLLCPAAVAVHKGLRTAAMHLATCRLRCCSAGPAGQKLCRKPCWLLCSAPAAETAGCACAFRLHAGIATCGCARAVCGAGARCRHRSLTHHLQDRQRGKLCPEGGGIKAPPRAEQDIHPAGRPAPRARSHRLRCAHRRHHPRVCGRDAVARRWPQIRAPPEDAGMGADGRDDGQREGDGHIRRVPVPEEWERGPVRGDDVHVRGVH